MEQRVGLEGMTNGNVEKPAAVRRMHCNYSAAEEKHQSFNFNCAASKASQWHRHRLRVGVAIIGSRQDQNSSDHLLKQQLGPWSDKIGLVDGRNRHSLSVK